MGGMAINRVAGLLGLMSVCFGRQSSANSALAAPCDAAPVAYVRQTMLFSGLAGFFLALASEWQIAVESAQAVAGAVAYQADNPFYMYHLKSWTLLHQLPAALLACGASERWISMLLAGLTGAISFQAIALCALAFSRDRLFSCVLPLACYVTNACRDLESVHQLRLLPREHWSIYGVFGTAYVLYVWSLLGVGYCRLGALLIGLAPAVHPVLGAWCLGIGSLSLALRWRREPSRAKQELAALASGMLLSGISLAAQLYLARGMPAVDVELANRLAAAFAHGWDNHRVPVPLTHPVMIAAACSTALSVIWLRYGAPTLASSAIVLLRCLAISAPVGLLLGISTQWQDRLPLPLVMAMPGRFNDLIAVAFPAVVLGLLARARGNLLLHALFSLVLVYLALKGVMMTSHRLYVPATIKVMPAVGLALLLAARHLTGASASGRGERTFWHLLRLAATVGLAVAAAYAWRRDQRLAWTIGVWGAALWCLGGSRQRWRNVEARLANWLAVRKVLQASDAGCLAAIAVMVVGPELALGLFAIGLFLARRQWLPAAGRFGLYVDRLSWGAKSLTLIAGLVLAGDSFSLQIRAAQAALGNWQNDPLFAALSRGEGLVLTASRIPLVQLQTRRGVLLYGAAVNQITYVPASAPAINEILREVYGEDLLRPRPTGWERCGGLMPGSGRKLWAERTPEEWLKLARRFGFTDVVTYADWTLQLPRVALDKRYAVFHIPSVETSPGPQGVHAHHSLARSPSKSDSTTAETSLPSVGK